MRKVCVFVMIAAVLATGGDSRRRIAVNRLACSGIQESEAFSLTNVLRTELGKTDVFQVMERAEMNRVLQEQGFQQSGACDASCAVEIGRILSVTAIVLGSVGRVGDTYNLNVRLVDVESGEIVTEVSRNHRGNVDALLTRVVPDAARELAGAKPKRNLFVPISVIAVGGAAVAALLYRGQDGEEDKEESKTDVRFKWAE